MQQVTLLATAAMGLEAVVERELRALGYNDLEPFNGGVEFKADLSAICRCNLWLRSADRVLAKLGQFPAGDFDQLFAGVSSIPWNDWLPIDASFPVNARTIKSRLHHPPSLQGVTKKAIVEVLKKHSSRYWLQETGPVFPIEIVLLGDVATVTLDTSGDGLHKRGYRQRVGPAPLRETTAAGLILLSYWNRDRPFLDPFCGSGTLPIEAALISRNRAPGLGRMFAAEHWPLISRDLWKQARDECRDLQHRKPHAPILASDISPQAIDLSKRHAREASVEADIQFQTLDVINFQTKLDYGVAVCNPPYGERLEDFDTAAEIYDDMADAFEPLKTWSVYVMTSHPRFEQCFRRRADRRRKLYAGKIACQYYQYFGPRPPGEKVDASEVDDRSTDDRSPDETP